MFFSPTLIPTSGSDVTGHDMTRPNLRACGRGVSMLLGKVSSACFLFGLCFLYSDWLSGLVGEEKGHIYQNDDNARATLPMNLS